MLQVDHTRNGAARELWLSKATVLITAKTSCPTDQPQHRLHCRVIRDSTASPLQSMWISTSGPCPCPIAEILPRNTLSALRPCGSGERDDDVAGANSHLEPSCRESFRSAATRELAGCAAQKGDAEPAVMGDASHVAARAPASLALLRGEQVVPLHDLAGRPGGGDACRRQAATMSVASRATSATEWLT